MRRAIFALTLLCTFFLSVQTVFAESNLDKFINIVNPVRISSYTENSGKSINSQYKVMKDYGFNGTWLLTDDVINDSNAYEAIKNFDKNQELGIFLEVTPAFSGRAGVTYNKSDSWFRAKSVLVVGYSQDERIKLIDTVFSDFYRKFGYYPTSVGAWWIDSYSLSYMKSKYNITANLDCSDQFMTDGYGIWGQYWSMPFYPNKINAAFPASDINNKLDIVTMQWAPRDPLNGYIKGSLYSTQDYRTLGFNDSYFLKLINLYTDTKYNSFGQVTVGLEGDFSPDIYQSMFRKQMEIIRDVSKNKNVQVVTMKKFSNWYREKFKEFTPPGKIETNDLLGTKTKVVWYQSPFYRIGLTYDYDSKETNVLDFRTYPSNFEEPYYFSADTELNLYMRTPAVIDTANNGDRKIVLLNKELEDVIGDSGNFSIRYKDKSEINLFQNKLTISSNIKLPDDIAKSKLVDLITEGGYSQILPNKNFNFTSSGMVFKELDPSSMNFLKLKRAKLIELFGFALVLVLLIALWRSNSKKISKIILTILVLGLVVGVIAVWINRNSTNYFVSQEEIGALDYLFTQPAGKVVVYDGICLQCTWKTKYPPAIFGNHRDYVSIISGKEIVYNNTLFNAKTRKESKQILESLDAKYIYVVRVGDYKEIVPFSPGDLGVKLIYENASSQIWQII